jgi:hypothetical protein
MTSWPDHLPSGNQKRFFEIALVLVRFDHVAVDLHLPERWLSLLIRRCEVVSKPIYFVRQLLF